MTDIEGSTRLFEQRPAAMEAALPRHDALVGETVMEHGGILVKARGEGDSLFVVFDRPSAAVDAAIALQRALLAEPWPGGLPLRVRIGIHSGEAEPRMGDYYGLAVNRCARIRSAAHGGQVLLSQAARELVRDVLPEGTGLRSLGEHRLRSLARPERIYQLMAADLPTEFPPLRTPEHRPGNLPVPATPLVGREREVRAAREALQRDDVRVLTFTGPGGTGKSRLALQVAASVVDDFPDGVYFVPLAPVHETELVLPTITHALGLREIAGLPLAGSLKEYLRDRRTLLVLDNFEQVIAAAPVVADLMAACPRVQAIATSREPLRLGGEQEFPVPPLDVPPAGAPVEVESLAHCTAVALFVQRARAVRPGFALTAENAAAVAGLCRRLDGLPLAIELAAARTRHLSPQALLERLRAPAGANGGAGLAVLSSGARDLPERQQTLRAAIAWSYDLLYPSEQTLFRRLAVFVGGFTADGAENVCAMDGVMECWSDGAMGAGSTLYSITPTLHHSAGRVLDTLASLVDKSLLRQEDGPGGEARFTMLGTIREFGLECMEAAGETAAIRRAHARHFLELVLAAEPALHGREQIGWLRRLDAEQENLRSALEWTISGARDAAGALQLASALHWYWFLRGHLAEGRSWLEEALRLSTAARAGAGAPDSAAPASGPQAPEATRLQAKGLYAASALAWVQGDYAAAGGYAGESLAAYRSLGDEVGAAHAQTRLGTALQSQGDLDTATQLEREAIAVLRREGDRWALALSLFRLGLALGVGGDPAEAQALLDESQAIFRELGDRWGLARTLNNLGELARYAGDDERASALYTESLALNRELGATWEIGVSLHNLGQVARRQGDNKRAERLFEESLLIYQELASRPFMAHCLAGLAEVAATERGTRSAAAAARRAVLLSGAAEAVLESSGGVMDPVDRAELERALAPARAALGDEAFTAALAEGRATPLEQAIDLALEG